MATIFSNIQNKLPRIKNYIRSIKLPDSWFLVLITVFLAITTLSVERFVAGIPFWVETTAKTFNLTIHKVLIKEYENGQLISIFTSPKIEMKSYENIKTDSVTTPSTTLPKNFEHWNFDKIQGVSRSIDAPINTTSPTKAIYNISAGNGYLEKENDVFYFNNGVNVSEIPAGNASAAVSATNQPSPRILTSKSGIYYPQKRIIEFNEGVSLDDDNTSIKGNKMNVDLQNGKIVIENIKGILTNPSTAPKVDN